MFKNHPFHLVGQSYNPFYITLPLAGIGLLFVSIFWSTDRDPNSLISKYQVFVQLFWVAVISLYLAMHYWGNDLDKEGDDPNVHTTSGLFMAEYGFLLFIASETLLFASFFWAYFNCTFSPSIWVGHGFPPLGVEPISAISLPLINTLLLVTSGATVNAYFYHLMEIEALTEVAYAQNAISAPSVDSSASPLLAATPLLIGHLTSLNLENTLAVQKKMVGFLTQTILLGVIFISIQGYEYSRAPFTISDTAYGSAFFLLTGLHGMHVFVGLVLLTHCLVKLCRGDYGAYAKPHLLPKLAGFYWHFVDVVWLYLFIFVYVLAN